MIYRLPVSVRDVVRLLPMLAGVARSLRGTMQPNGYELTDGRLLGLPFDVWSNPGDTVYGPLHPPPGMPVMQASPYAGSVNTQGPITTQSTVTAPPVSNYNAGKDEGLTPVVLPAVSPDPGEWEDIPREETIGKETGDTFSFEDVLTRAEELAPWYIWAATGAGAVLLLAAMLHHREQKRRGKR